MVLNKALTLGLVAGLLSGCAMFKSKPKPAPAIHVNEDPYPSTYVRYPGVLTVIRHATVFDGDGKRYDDGTVIFADGVMQAVGGPELASPAGALEVDGTGKYVTPEIIDIHSHLGDYPSPQVDALSDGNEATSPVRPEVWAEHSVWPQDPGFSRALINGGVTTLQVLPGSANLFGGRSVVLKNVPGRTTQDMKFPGAPLRSQNGVRRESQARLRFKGQHAADADGQYRTRPADVDQGPGLQAQMGQILP